MSSNQTTLPMLSVLSAIGIDPAKINHGISQAFSDYLFDRKGNKPAFKDKDLQDALLYLGHIVDIEGISTATELSDYFEKFNAHNQQLIQAYGQADILEKLEIEDRLRMDGGFLDMDSFGLRGGGGAPFRASLKDGLLA